MKLRRTDEKDEFYPIRLSITNRARCAVLAVGGISITCYHTREKEKWPIFYVAYLHLSRSRRHSPIAIAIASAFHVVVDVGWRRHQHRDTAVALVPEAAIPP